MDKGSIVGSIDVAQVVLYTFFVFFAGLVFYLRREDKREGYPLVSDRSESVSVIGFPAPPKPKTFILPHGGTAMAPRGTAEPKVTGARATAKWPGAPIEPTGNPMTAGVGPGSSVLRADVTDKTADGAHKIVPMRTARDYTIEERDPDPRGMSVIAADREVAGTVRDIWVDRSECLIRYLEVETRNGKRVLLPWTFSKLDRMRKRINVSSIMANQFSGVPGTKSADRVTLREEDEICAYFGAGKLYAKPSRAEPLL
jgi:photosynthetic reaction center H subunit